VWAEVPSPLARAMASWQGRRVPPGVVVQSSMPVHPHPAVLRPSPAAASMAASMPPGGVRAAQVQPMSPTSRVSPWPQARGPPQGLGHSYVAPPQGMATPMASNAQTPARLGSARAASGGAGHSRATLYPGTSPARSGPGSAARHPAGHLVHSPRPEVRHCLGPSLSASVSAVPMMHLPAGVATVGTTVSGSFVAPPHAVGLDRTWRTVEEANRALTSASWRGASKGPNAPSVSTCAPSGNSEAGGSTSASVNGSAEIRGRSREPSSAAAPTLRAASQDQRSQLWGPGQSIKVGTAVDMVELAREVRLLDKSAAASVKHAVEQLNCGALRCPEGHCMVYSASSDTYFLLYRLDRQEAVMAKYGRGAPEESDAFEASPSSRRRDPRPAHSPLASSRGMASKPASPKCGQSANASRWSLPLAMRGAQTQRQGPASPASSNRRVSPMQPPPQLQPQQPQAQIPMATPPGSPMAKQSRDTARMSPSGSQSLAAMAVAAATANAVAVENSPASHGLNTFTPRSRKRDLFVPSASPTCPGTCPGTPQTPARGGRAGSPPAKPASNKGSLALPVEGRVLEERPRARPTAFEAPADSAEAAAYEAPAKGGHEVEIGNRPFELFDVIGRGAFGVVWRSRARGDEKDIAVKVVSAKDTAAFVTAAFEAELLQILTAAGTRSSKHVPQYVAHSSTRSGNKEGGGVVRLAMSYVKGGALDRWLYGISDEEHKTVDVVQLVDGHLPGGQQGSWLLSDACKVVHELVAQLAGVFASLEPIAYHRDVSSHNVLVDFPNGFEKPDFALIDFGLAVRSGSWNSEWRNSNLAGDPRYWTCAAWMAFAFGFKYVATHPNAGFQKQYLTRMDHFSLGVLGLETLFALWHTGEAYEGSTPGMLEARAAWAKFWISVIHMFQMFHMQGAQEVRQYISQSQEEGVASLVDNLRHLRQALRVAAVHPANAKRAALLLVLADLIDEKGTATWAELPAMLQEDLQASAQNRRGDLQADAGSPTGVAGASLSRSSATLAEASPPQVLRAAHSRPRSSTVDSEELSQSRPAARAPRGSNPAMTPETTRSAQTLEFSSPRPKPVCQSHTLSPDQLSRTFSHRRRTSAFT